MEPYIQAVEEALRAVEALGPQEDQPVTQPQAAQGMAPQPLRSAMKYSLLLPGKRLRPVLLLAAYHLVAEDWASALPFACALEMIHAYSLIHDDLPALDDDALRRGKPTNHRVYGEAMAILAGDGLLNLAYETMLGSPIARREPRLALAAALEIARRAGVTGMIAGQALDATLEALAALHPAARSVALVPVGLTGHREGLCPLTPYDAASAAALLAQAHAWQEAFWARLGTRFVFAADEFYALSGQPLPPEEAYEDYPQLENGVGLLRSFREAFYGARALAAQETAVPRRVLVATGVSAAPYLRALVSHAAPAGVQARALAVENRFFGGHVTVAGLLTGSDLLHALAGEEADEILISQAMLRREDALFLDDMPLDALRARLGVAVHAVPCDGADFFYALLGEQYQTED